MEYLDFLRLINSAVLKGRGFLKPETDWNILDTGSYLVSNSNGLDSASSNYPIINGNSAYVISLNGYSSNNILLTEAKTQFCISRADHNIYMRHIWEVNSWSHWRKIYPDYSNISLQTNGYIVFTNGLVLQWGWLSSTNWNGPRAYAHGVYEYYTSLPKPLETPLGGIIVASLGGNLFDRAVNASIVAYTVDNSEYIYFKMYTNSELSQLYNFQYINISFLNS